METSNEDFDAWLEAKATNAVMRRLARRQPVAALGIRSSRSTDIVRFARASGHHAIWIDLEHSTMPLDIAGAICGAALDQGLVPFVRVPEREYGVIGRLLDAGAAGIIVPRVETADQAADAVLACRFPPHGHRSAIATLPCVDFRRLPPAQLYDVANRVTVVEVLLESPLGIEHCEAIARVPGIDLIGIGVNDLSAEFGVPGEFRHPLVTAALESALAACARAGKPLAIGGIPDHAYSAEWIARGAAPYLMTGIDSDVLLAGLQQRVTAALASLSTKAPT